MRCAIYCRLSREDEEKLLESESIQNQRALLLDYAAGQNWTVVQSYCDEDYSGIDRERPGFCAMLQGARQGAFEIILCKTQSRFTRDMELVERYIHGLFPLWGIRFVAIADHSDTALQGNKKARQINGLVNEWYLEDLSENIRMVLDHKRRQGQHIGAAPLYGYRKDPAQKGHLVIDPPAAAVVQQIFRLAAQGLGKQRIATHLNEQLLPNPTHYKLEQGAGYGSSRQDSSSLWSRGTVGRILSNEMYLGTMIQGRNRKASYKHKTLRTMPPEAWFRVEGTHEPIITQPLFDAVQLLRKRHCKSDGSGEPHPLAGLVYCGQCGAALQKRSYRYKENRRSYLYCRQDGCACSVPLDSLLSFLQERIHFYLRQWYPVPKPTPSVQAPPPSSIVPTPSAAYAAALEQLYLDRVTGLISPEQFSLLSQRLSAREQAFSQPSTPTVQPAPDATQTLWQEDSAIPRALLLLLIENIELMPRCQQQQGLRIHWNF